MSLSLKAPSAARRLIPRIAVLGIGGAGGNAVDTMIAAGLTDVEYYAANSDAQALERCKCPNRLQLGRGATQGLGAGARPEVGRAAAEESREDLRAQLDGCHLVFLAVGLGGGTGTGGAPVIAEALRESGALVIAVATKPFDFEGARRMRTAEAGLLELARQVDTLLILPNQNLFRVANERTSFAEAFRMADGVLLDGVRAVSDLILRPGFINLDFADLRAVIAGMGRALMGAGEASGDGRALEAARLAVENPLLEGMTLGEVRALLVNVTGGEDLTLHEIQEAVDHISTQVDPAADLIFGSALDPALAGRMRVSVVATGLDPAMPGSHEGLQRAVALSLVAGQTPTPSPLPAKAMPAKTAVAEPAPENLPLEAARDESEDAAAAAPAAPELPLMAAPAEPELPLTAAAPATTRPVLQAPKSEEDEIATLAQPEASLGSAAGLIERLVGGLGGDAEALYQRAECLYHGHDTPKNLTAACRLFRRAAKRGHAGAQNRLGWMLERGEGGETNLSEAAQWHRRAAEQGHLNGMNDLGFLYRQGRGVPRDFEQALYWLRRAAEQDYSFAEFNLGQMYERGWGVERDLGAAVDWYRRAAGRNHTWAGKRLKDLGVAT